MCLVRSKNQVTSSNLRKTFALTLEATFFCPILEKLGQNFCLNDISDEYENGSFRVKNLVNRSNLRKKKKKKTIVYALEITFSV